MIIVKLQGGLGNQLFQYAIGKRLAVHHKTDLKFDTSFLGASIAGVTPRKLELDQLVNAAIATREEIQSFSNSSNLLHRVKKFLSHSTYIKEKSFRFDPGFLQYGSNCYLDGFWQSEKYFIGISDLIKNELRYTAPLDEANISMKAAIAAANAVSIHVRRGDYINNPAARQFHGSCSLEYYKQAVALLSSRVNDPHFFIFSDDVQWVAANFITGINSTIVDINNGDAVKDMQLMSACKHHIIANSSFSWWSAWLGSNTEKMVVGPKQWFADATVDTGTVLPDSWYKL